MTIRLADPLPECSLCEAPTARDAHERNGGLCTPCATGVADTVRMLPVRGGVVDLDNERNRRRRLEHLVGDHEDATAYVERWLPPVPGQLELPEGER